MAQITSGLRSILSHPMVYNTFQMLVGASRARRIFVDDYLGIKDVSRLLDIGCGTAELLQHLPAMIHYVGFDASARYIETAKRKFSHRHAEFIAKQVAGSVLAAYERFDRITATGLLHHLGDNEVLHLFQLAKGALGVEGFFVSIDPCYVENQSRISKMIVDCDRGKNIRTLSDYKHLAESVFYNVDIHHRNDLLRIPYDHAVLVCS
ncbi:MAG: class I SAM-dependent methyltransferase [Nitrospirales bacterium]|nr:MAG: class I SAM-dependent methyltransferase [Nitrospirales bacterium]